MPLAKSPITSEILPRPPNSSTATNPNSRMCQMLNVPMELLSFDRGDDARSQRNPQRGTPIAPLKTFGLIEASLTDKDFPFPAKNGGNLTEAFLHRLPGDRGHPARYIQQHAGRRDAQLVVPQL